MKIIYLHQYFLTPDMAGGTRSYEMARRLVTYGHEVHIVTTWFDSAAPASSKSWFSRNVDGITVHWLPVPYSNKLGFVHRMLAFFRFALSAGRRAHIIGGDLVFATSTPLTIAIPALYAKWKLRVPMVFEVRDLWPELPIAIGALKNPLLIKLARWLEKCAYRNSTRVVALSPGMADGVTRAGYSRSRVSIIPNSSDLELFDPLVSSPELFRDAYPEIGNGPVVLYPGTLGKINGVSWLAELAEHVYERRPDVRFVVIGDGAERDLIERRARELSVYNKNFFMFPKLPKRTIVSAFSAASVVISLFLDLPEMQANSANKFFDSLASATPIAINYGGWQKDLIEEAGVGIALGPDPQAAAAALISFMSSSDAMATAGGKARQLAVDLFSRDKLAKQLESVLLDAFESDQVSLDRNNK